MSRVTRRSVLLGALGALGGCQEPAAPAPSLSSSAAASVGSRGLPEGAIAAFGLTLPAGTVVVRRSSLSLVARVPASIDRTIEYVKGRLVEGTLEATPERAEIAKARFAGGSKQIGTLRVVLERALESTELTLRRNLDS